MIELREDHDISAFVLGKAKNRDSLFLLIHFNRTGLLFEKRPKPVYISNR